MDKEIKLRIPKGDGKGKTAVCNVAFASSNNPNRKEDLDNETGNKAERPTD